MSDIPATCINGHDVTAIEPGTACPECGDTSRRLKAMMSGTSTLGIAKPPDVEPMFHGTSTLGGPPPPTASIELKGSGTLGVGAMTTANVELTASGIVGKAAEPSPGAPEDAPPVVDDTQEVILLWTPIDAEAGTWMLQVHREGEVTSIGMGDSFLRAIRDVLKQLYPND